jgi:1-acyl-sn-glycerol-3-phosphate acyltransferase
MAALDQLLDHETLTLLREAALTPVDPDDVRRDNNELIQRLVPAVDALIRLYFRLDVEGLDKVPEGRSLLVFNHDSGTTSLPILGLGARYYLERGYGERLIGLMHDALFEVPALGNLLGALGAVRASPENADEVLRRGHKVVVAPGGNLEAFRPYSARHTIRFGGRTGWIKLALRHGVPITPVVFIGGQETFFVLHDGQALARALGLKKRFRLDTFPIFLGLPWGIGLGPIFHIPLPAKCQAKILDPISLEGTSPEDADDPRVVRELYALITHTMQDALEKMAARRRIPFFG